jgi:uncharacterized protein
MGKIVFWIGLILVVVAGFRLAGILQRRQRAAEEARRRRDASAPREQSVASEAMQRCAHCGVHAPSSEMISARGRHYCSAEHRDADR